MFHFERLKITEINRNACIYTIQINFITRLKAERTTHLKPKEILDYSIQFFKTIFVFPQEYETLTNKIHELQVKEEDLLAKMPNEEEQTAPLPTQSTSTPGGGVQPSVTNSLPSPKPVHGIIKAYLPNEQFSLVYSTIL